MGEVCDVVADGAPLPVKRGRRSASVPGVEIAPDSENLDG